MAIYGNLGQFAYTDYLIHPLSFKFVKDKANYLFMSVNMSIKPELHLHPSVLLLYFFINPLVISPQLAVP